MSILMPLGAALFCLGCLLNLAHQRKVGPRPPYLLSYLGIALLCVSAVMFVAGAMMMEG